MNYSEFVVNINLPSDETLRGKFKAKIKLSYRDILSMDAMRRSYLGAQPGEPDGVASTIAMALAKINTHCVETPSWWKEAGNGLDFEDLDVVLTVYQELQKVENEYLKKLKKEAVDAGEALKKDVPAEK
jgi:hypothetical protein